MSFNYSSICGLHVRIETEFPVYISFNYIFPATRCEVVQSCRVCAIGQLSVYLTLRSQKRHLHTTGSLSEVYESVVHMFII